jgi:feruloyl esterase
MRTRKFCASVAACGLAPLLIGASGASQPQPRQEHDLTATCTPDAVQAIAPKGVTVKPIKNGMFETATRLVPASGNIPAFCQVSGSFLTNPATGKTANFIATFPAAWNGKYMQLGCSGHCGQFYVSNPAFPTVTVSAQGYPGQIIEKGYATFATDEGHEGMDSASWALRKDGSVDQDYVDDWLFRSVKVMTVTGKSFSTAFYSAAMRAPQKIARSYFNGCSGGGRDAMVVASYFPEAFDGIIAGSPYDPIGMTFLTSAVGRAESRPGGALTPALLKLVDVTAKKQCDAVDGVKDGLIQNPAACNFNAERDLPRCSAGAPVGQCFSDTQIETVSVMTSAVTDEKGNFVQPGYSISEFDVQGKIMASLTDPTLKIFVHKNDPNFEPASVFTFKRGGPGSITGFHTVVPAIEVAKTKAALRLGAGHLMENSGRLMNSRTKLLMWHNSSDEKLTPFSSVNWYKKLAAKHGGYAKVQQTARLFMLPGTAHCSMSSVGPNSFDAISAMEDWAEKGQAPNGLMSSVVDRQFTPGMPKAPALASPNWTMPLCKFPELARYSGRGDTMDGTNWSCQKGDVRGLAIGETGRRAGVLK